MLFPQNDKNALTTFLHSHDETYPHNEEPEIWKKILWEGVWFLDTFINGVRHDGQAFLEWTVDKGPSLRHDDKFDFWHRTDSFITVQKDL